MSCCPQALPSPPSALMSPDPHRAQSLPALGCGDAWEVGTRVFPGLSPAPPRSYLVMPFMGTDLGKLMKLEKLSEDRVQFLVYQMLKGLKVRMNRWGVPWLACGCEVPVSGHADPLSVPTVHPRCWRRSQGESRRWWELLVRV